MRDCTCAKIVLHGNAVAENDLRLEDYVGVPEAGALTKNPKEQNPYRQDTMFSAGVLKTS